MRIGISPGGTGVVERLNGSMSEQRPRNLSFNLREPAYFYFVQP
jgi:hypothetical protein